MTDVADWWQTAIIDMEPGRIDIRGRAIQDLIGNLSFAEMVWLMLTYHKDPWLTLVFLLKVCLREMENLLNLMDLMKLLIILKMLVLNLILSDCGENKANVKLMKVLIMIIVPNKEQMVLMINTVELAHHKI